MADYRGSTTNPETRDRTRTPPWLFKAINCEFNFVLDAACLPETACCEKYLTPSIDSLAVSWGDFISPSVRAPWVWLNPPYSNIGPWIDKARIEQMNGIGTVLLVPQDTTAKWYAKASANEIRHITGGYDNARRWVSGRVNFVDAITGEELKGNPKGSTLLIFAPGYARGPQVIREVKITDLMMIGGAYDV